MCCSEFCQLFNLHTSNFDIFQDAAVLVQYLSCHPGHHTCSISNVTLKDSVAAAVTDSAGLRQTYSPLYFPRPAKLSSHVLLYLPLSDFY